MTRRRTQQSALEIWLRIRSGEASVSLVYWNGDLAIIVGQEPWERLPFARFLDCLPEQDRVVAWRLLSHLGPPAA